MAVIVKIQQTVLSGEESISIIAIGFSSASVISFLVYLIITVKKTKFQKKENFQLLRKSIPFILLISVGNGVANIINTKLITKVPGAYLFPSVLGGSMILVVIFAVFILKEKITLKGVWGIAIGIIAMVLINT